MNDTTPNQGRNEPPQSERDDLVRGWLNQPENAWLQLEEEVYQESRGRHVYLLDDGSYLFVCRQGFVHNVLND